MRWHSVVLSPSLLEPLAPPPDVWGMLLMSDLNPLGDLVANYGTDEDSDRNSAEALGDPVSVLQIAGCG